MGAAAGGAAVPSGRAVRAAEAGLSVSDLPADESLRRVLPPVILGRALGIVLAADGAPLAPLDSRAGDQARAPGSLGAHAAVWTSQGPDHPSPVAAHRGAK